MPTRRAHPWAVAPWLALLTLAACGAPASDDAGEEDSGLLDAGMDAGAVDAGMDAGAVDAGGDAGAEDAGADAGELDGGQADAGPLAAGLYALTLDAGAFPPSTDHPSAVVYVPQGFRPTTPLGVVVYLHGFDNCVLNIVNDAGSSCDPDAGTPARNAYALMAQLEASGKNALLLCPELTFDAATGNPGRLGTDGGFRALLAETLDDLSFVLGPHTPDEVGPLVVASHSGGYEAAAGIVREGGVEVNEVWLFDSLYGYTQDFDDWVLRDLAGIASVQRRFGDVYTYTGGTSVNSQAMADRAATWVDAGSIVDDRTTSTWPPQTYDAGLLFKQSALSHDDVPRYYFRQFLQTSTLADR